MTYIDGFTLEQLLDVIQSTEEMQAVLFISLCCLGAWVVLSWIIQIIRSVLWIWPLLLVAVLLVAVPSLRITLTQDLIPKQVDGFMNLIDKKYYHYSNATWYNS